MSFRLPGLGGCWLRRALCPHEGAAWWPETDAGTVLGVTLLRLQTGNAGVSPEGETEAQGVMKSRRKSRFTHSPGHFLLLRRCLW